MEAEEEHLKPHGIFGKQTFDEYCASIPEFYLKPEVPEDVRLNFAVIKKLLVFSYYEYKFFDVAFSKCLTTMEMAMRIRTKELDIYDKKDTFDPLLKKLTQRNLFEFDYPKMKLIKDMRNWDVHPEGHTVGGGHWNRFEMFAFLMNELYENVELRLERKEKFKELEERLQTLALERNVAIEIDGKPSILYRFGLLYINNKYEPPTYVFVCTPLFDITVEKNTSIKVPQSFVSRLTDLKINKDSIEGISFKNKKKVKVLPVSMFPELAKVCEKWDIEYNKCDGLHLARFESARTFVYPYFINSEIREFQKM